MYRLSHMFGICILFNSFKISFDICFSLCTPVNRILLNTEASNSYTRVLHLFPYLPFHSLTDGVTTDP